MMVKKTRFISCWLVTHFEFLGRLGLGLLLYEGAWFIFFMKFVFNKVSMKLLNAVSFITVALIVS